MATIFKGFSTIDKIRAPYTLTDNELVKRDLLNHFYTKKGERPMRPNFGCIIWDLLMEPDSPGLQEQIKEDIERIVDADPRVEYEECVLYIADHTIRAEVSLKYYNIEEPDTLYLEYRRQSSEVI